MNNLNGPKIGVGVLIVHDHRVLLGKRLGKHGIETMGPPGGHLELGETLEACAIREVKEETGLIIDAPRFVAFTNDVFGPDKHYLSFFMLCEYPGGEILNPEPTKVESWDWYPLSELPSNLFLPLSNYVDGQQYGSSFESLSMPLEESV